MASPAVLKKFMPFRRNFIISWSSDNLILFKFCQLVAQILIMELQTILWKYVVLNLTGNVVNSRCLACQNYWILRCQDLHFQLRIVNFLTSTFHCTRLILGFAYIARKLFYTKTSSQKLMFSCKQKEIHALLGLWIIFHLTISCKTIWCSGNSLAS